MNRFFLGPYLFNSALHSFSGFDCGHPHINELAQERVSDNPDDALVITGTEKCGSKKPVVAFLVTSSVLVNERDAPYVAAGVAIHPRLSAHVLRLEIAGVDRQAQNHGLLRYLVTHACRAVHGDVSRRMGYLAALEAEALPSALPVWEALGFEDKSSFFQDRPLKGPLLLHPRPHSFIASTDVAFSPIIAAYRKAPVQQMRPVAWCIH